jgi:serine/threonine protein kinase
LAAFALHEFGGALGVRHCRLPAKRYNAVETHTVLLLLLLSLAGTPNYMAPELFNGTRVDEAADVYSLGCILYECLARKQPFSNLAGNGGKSFNMLFKVRARV